MEPEETDLLVIGAGWAGIAVAKTFHQLQPSKALVIIDANASIGGTWASERISPGLKTNNQLGTYEFPDFPMSTDVFGVKPGEHIPGHVVHDYLEKVAERFDIADKIRYSTRAVSAEHQAAGGWLVKAVEGGTGRATTTLARKLVVASGLTSAPFLPRFDGQAAFGKPVFHGGDCAQHAHTIATAKRVTVFGGTKTGWDAVYAYASKGVHVDWVIRASGHGPAWMAPPFVTPLNKWLEKLVMTRALTWFSPCAWGDADGYSRIRNFLHGTAMGRFITDAFWSLLGNDVVARNNYKAHPETAKLQPWSHPMFVGASFSILNYDTDFFALLRTGAVTVHVADITGLRAGGIVQLSTNAEVTTDALVCVTGWKWTAPLQFLPEGIAAELGVPHPPAPADRTDLVAQADREIRARWPRLQRPPVPNKRYVPLTAQTGLLAAAAAAEDKEGEAAAAEAASSPHGAGAARPLTPWRLYRFMVPAAPALLRRRDIAFAGMLMSTNVPLIAHLQALWIHAYFLGRGLALPRPDAAGAAWLQYETVLHSRFGRWRCPAGHGGRFPDLVFDALPYVDLLARDLGLRVHRKAGALAEIAEPYGPRDYVRVVQEWQREHHID